MAAVDPAVHLERFPRHQHVAGADDGAPGLVHDLGRDRVLVVLVTVQLLGRGGVERNFHRAVGADRHFLFKDDLGLLAVPAAPPDRNGAPHAPVGEPRIPGIIAGEPPVALAVEPVPGAARIPAGTVARAQHLVFHLGIGDG